MTETKDVASRKGRPSNNGPAVLFIVFRRLESTKTVFEAIRRAAIPRLYIAADGPRPGRTEESAEVRSVREYVTSHIDWSCKIHTLFREENIGCRRAVSSALRWFFEQEEQGIILEDDCVPSDSFFPYCDELLNRYRSDDRIGMISGRNNLDEYPNGQYSYLFSDTGSIWGWATWRRVAERFDSVSPIFTDPRIEEYLYSATRDRSDAAALARNLSLITRGALDTWDYSWTAHLHLNHMLSVVPTHNLIRNIGFASDATHTRNPWTNLARLSAHELELPLAHPPIVVADPRFSRAQSRVAAGGIFKRVARTRAIRPFVLRVLSLLPRRTA